MGQWLQNLSVPSRQPSAQCLLTQPFLKVALNICYHQEWPSLSYWLPSKQRFPIQGITEVTSQSESPTLARLLSVLLASQKVKCISSRSKWNHKTRNHGFFSPLKKPFVKHCIPRPWHSVWRMAALKKFVWNDGIRSFDQGEPGWF